MEDTKSWFTWMEVIDSIYHQCFFTANSLGRQPTTLQFFQPLTPQTLALVAAVIHCALSEYATGIKVTVLFSQDEYRGKFCPSKVIDLITAETTALINYTWWGVSYPPPQWCSSAIIGATQSPSPLLRLDWCFSISLSPACRSLCWGSSFTLGTPQCPPRPRFGVPLFHPRLITSCPIRHCSAWMGCSARSTLLNSCRHSLAWLCAPHFHSKLLHHYQHSLCPPCTPHQALLLSWWRTSLSPKFILLRFKLHFNSLRANLAIPTF